LQLYVHGEQDLHVSRHIREEGIWEPYETSLVLSLLKVDTQGSEYAVIEGLLSLLRKLPRIPRIIIELTPLSLRLAGAP
jgi:hypothetical protein